MKKLLAMLTVGGVLALTTGCPPAPSTEKVPPKGPPAAGAGSRDNNPDHNNPDHKAAADKAAADKAAADKAAADKAADKAAADKAADKAAADKPAADKTVTGKVEKGALMVDGKEMKVPADAEVWVDGKKDELKNAKDGSTATVTEKDGKVIKVEVKK